MKKIAMAIIVANTMLAIGCAKQKENTQTNEMQPRLIKGRVVDTKGIRIVRMMQVEYPNNRYN